MSQDQEHSWADPTHVGRQSPNPKRLYERIVFVPNGSSLQMARQLMAVSGSSGELDTLENIARAVGATDMSADALEQFVHLNAPMGELLIDLADEALPHPLPVAFDIPVTQVIGRIAFLLDGRTEIAKKLTDNLLTRIDEGQVDKNTVIIGATVKIAECTDPGKPDLSITVPLFPDVDPTVMNDPKFNKINVFLDYIPEANEPTNGIL